MRPTTPHPCPRPSVAGWVVLMTILLVLAGALPNVATARPGSPDRRLSVEAVEVLGNARTDDGTAIDAAGLRPGDPLSPESIQAAAIRLREARLFREVRVHTRPGSEPGRVVVVFTVKENRPHLRLGVGNEDLSGWYLIPIQLNLDNLLGMGARFDVSARIGYRVSGLVTTWRREDAHDPRRFVQVRLAGEGVDRVYFLDRTEVVHRLNRNHQELRLGRPITRGVGLETWVAHERVDAGSTPEAYRANEVDDIEQGDPIPFHDLPPDIASAMGTRDRGRLGLGLVTDTRTGHGLRQRGLWGRVGVEAVFGDSADFGVARAELRGYLPVGDLLLAGRVQGASTDASAPFYDRFYLGGLYTIRGYPSQALSRPEGDLHQLTGSIELRAPMIGPVENPRLTAIAFLDGGLGWSDGSPDPEEEGGAGIGWGIRWRLPLVDQIGVDVGRPLGDSPVEEAFHVNVSLGWSF